MKSKARSVGKVYLDADTCLSRSFKYQFSNRQVLQSDAY